MPRNDRVLTMYTSFCLIALLLSWIWKFKLLYLKAKLTLHTTLWANWENIVELVSPRGFLTNIKAGGLSLKMPEECCLNSCNLYTSVASVQMHFYPALILWSCINFSTGLLSYLMKASYCIFNVFCIHCMLEYYTEACYPSPALNTKLWTSCFYTHFHLSPSHPV